MWKYFSYKFTSNLQKLNLIKQLSWLIWYSYIYWGYNISDNESCPILKMMCSVVGLLTWKKTNNLFVYNTSDKQWCKPLSDFQDVMLSATSTQSPLATVSSVFTMPNISMPTVSLANSGGLGGLTDHLFMSHIPADPPNAHSNSVTDTHTDKSGTWNFEFQKKKLIKNSIHIFSHFNEMILSFRFGVISQSFTIVWTTPGGSTTVLPHRSGVKVILYVARV